MPTSPLKCNLKPFSLSRVIHFGFIFTKIYWFLFALEYHDQIALLVVHFLFSSTQMKNITFKTAYYKHSHILIQNLINMFANTLHESTIRTFSFEQIIYTQTHVYLVQYKLSAHGIHHLKWFHEAYISTKNTLDTLWEIPRQLKRGVIWLNVNISRSICTHKSQTG